MTLEQGFSELDCLKVARDSNDHTEYELACEVWVFQSGLTPRDTMERLYVATRYVYGTAPIYTPAEFDRKWEELGVSRFAPDHGGPTAFMAAVKFIDTLSGFPDDERAAIESLHAYLDRPITQEEQAQYDAGAFRFDDV